MKVRLEHGSGGALSHQLIEELIFPRFKGRTYAELADSTVCPLSGETVVTTDSYVVDPPVFPGGDIGKLAVFGTCNDLSVAGGKPRFLTLGLILEEGLEIAVLERLLQSVRAAADAAAVEIVSGDTKVVPTGKGGGIYINTAGIATKVFPHTISRHNVREGDAIIVSGPIGSHGIAVLAAREKLSVGGRLESDLAFLYPLCEMLFDLGGELRFVRDATRGGVAAVFNEMVHGSQLGAEVIEDRVPVLSTVAAVSDILGLNPLEIANEGVLVAVVSADSADQAIARLRSHQLGRSATRVGTIAVTRPGRVVLETSVGGKRVLGFPRGLLLPRIC